MHQGQNRARVAREDGAGQQVPLVGVLAEVEYDDEDDVGFRAHLALDEPKPVAVTSDEVNFAQLALLIIDPAQLSHILNAILRREVNRRLR